MVAAARGVMSQARVLALRAIFWPYLALCACAASGRELDAARDEESESSPAPWDGGAELDGAPSQDASRLEAGSRDATLPADGASTARVAAPPLAALPACPGYTHPPAGQACRVLSDCGGGSFACGPSVIHACGVCPSQAPPCSDDAQCGAGAVCDPAPALATGFPLSGCVSACTASSCALGKRCAANGHCELPPCTEGGDCPADRVCAPSRSGADARGCAAKSCESDGFICPPLHRCGGAQRDAHGCSPRLCSEDYSCPAGSHCGGASPDAHGCSLIHCSDGYTCPPNTDCKSEQKGGHGCAQRSCSVDGDCDCGACLARKCENQLNVCSWGAP